MDATNKGYDHAAGMNMTGKMSDRCRKQLMQL